MKGDNQGKEKKRLHACYCFYVEGIPKQKEKGYQDYHPLDDHARKRKEALTWVGLHYKLVIVVLYILYKD